MSTTFEYRARDNAGNLRQGSLEADSPEEATLRLKRDGLQVLKVTDADDAAAAAGGLFARRITRAEIIYTTSQLAIMVETGISLTMALGSIIEQEQNPTLRHLLDDIKASIESGEDFSSALARHPKYFDTTYVALVRASESTGTLGEMLERIAQYLRKDLETRSKVKSAMAYPCVMAIAAVNVTIFLLAYIFPKFTPLFAQKKMQLPMPTVVVLAISNALTNYWYLFVAGIALAIAGVVFGRHTDLGRKIIDWIKINTPAVGTLTRKVIISRSIRTLGAMLRGGVPMLESLELCAAVSGNYYYRELWNRVASEITTGSTLQKALAGTSLLPPTLVQMISSGEETGKLGFVLDRVSNYYDHEVETAVKAVTSLIEPIMITIMGGVVGGIGMALMLPIFKLSTSH
ncbi:MAG: type II secretion system F family protein [Pirellulales bacterium]|nr:type II secretion system F family protein [Pirellulales bacterium]